MTDQDGDNAYEEQWIVLSEESYRLSVEAGLIREGILVGIGAKVCISPRLPEDNDDRQ